MVSSQRLPMGIRDNINDDCIVYSPNKYRETEGIKDLFNKSHSFSYAVICFQTAYLKTYYTIFFFKALFNLNKDKVGMINKYILDATAFNVPVLPPDINKSVMNFSVYNDSILFGLSAIKGIGEKCSDKILLERTSKFKSMEDFVNRVQPNTREMVALIKSGAIPTKNKRKCLIKYLKSLYVPLQFREVQKAPSYNILRDDFNMDIEKYRIGTKKYDYDKDKILAEYNRIKKQQFDEKQKIRYKKFIEENNKYLENEEFWEFEALQIFITNNPFDVAYNYLPQFEKVEVGEKCTIVGIVAKVQKKKDKQKKQFAFINIYSSFGLVEGIVWHTQLKEYEDFVKNGTQLALLVRKEGDESVVVEKMKPYSKWIQEKIRKR